MKSILPLIFVFILFSCDDDDTKKSIDESIFHKNENVRVPAEWEPQKSIWMQWATRHDTPMQKAFSDIIKVVKQYEQVNLIANSDSDKNEGIKYLANNGINQDSIIWHVYPTDNSWLRDNGPIYVTNGKKMWIQNWRFDGWGSSFGGDVDYKNDNLIPIKMGEVMGLEVEDRQAYILEKGNVEVNSKSLLLINWDCQNQRNPNLTKEQHELILRNAMGIKDIIWSYGHYPDDGTYGHIDGIVRFVNDSTVFIPDYNTKIENDMKKACEDYGLNVVIYPGDPNWLVGNGFVVAMGADNNDELRELLEEYFPNRDIHFVEASIIAKNGGGIHCVTNDEPLFVK
jgi:agmatine deiminase